MGQMLVAGTPRSRIALLSFTKETLPQLTLRPMEEGCGNVSPAIAEVLIIIKRTGLSGVLALSG